MSKTLDQARAAFAWQKTEKSDDAFKSLVSGAPSLIMTNGLMQALAFYKEKNHQELLQALLEWLARALQLENAKFETVMKALHESNADTYFRATEEALAILKWIRQYAKARAR